MPDLSQLSDEQLSIYRDMLAKKQAPVEQSGVEKAISNIPSSLYKTVTHPYGEGMPASVQERFDTKHGEYPPQFQDYLPDIKKFMAHPIDTAMEGIKNRFTADPVGSTLGAYAGARQVMPSTFGTAEAGMAGAGRAALQQVRPTLDKFSLWHPLKNIGLGYDALKNTVQGGADAANEYRGVNPTIPDAHDPEAAKRLGKQLLKRAKGLGKDTRGSVDLGTFGGSGSGEPATMPNAATETRQVAPVSQPGTQGPETPTARPTRNVIYDENNEPVAYDDPSNAFNDRRAKIRPVETPQRRSSDQLFKPGTEAPDVNQPSQEIRPVAKTNPIDKPYEEMQKSRRAEEQKSDVFHQIANEGIEKRVADAKAKYEDVYNNVIKGNYTPEQLRNLTPEDKTAIDLKIKGMKHVEPHPKAGTKKYSSGLNPAVAEHLASRLENEP